MLCDTRRHLICFDAQRLPNLFTDTLVIDVEFPNYAPPYNTNSIKVYPNPARDHLMIHTGNFGLIYDYQLKIIDQLGAIVFETFVRDFLYQYSAFS